MVAARAWLKRLGAGENFACFFDLSLVAEFEEKFSEVLILTGSISPSALAPEDRSTLEVIRARALFALGDRDSALRAVRRAEGKAVNKVNDDAPIEELSQGENK